MKVTVIVAFLLGTAASLQAQKMDSKDVPATVKAGFQKTYSVKDVTWDKEGDNYEASFKEKRKETSIVLDATGNIVETEIEIAKSELPAAVLAALKKDYADYEIEEAARITANGVVTYEAEVENGEQTFALIFDAQGKVLKKEEEKEADKD